MARSAASGRSSLTVPRPQLTFVEDVQADVPSMWLRCNQVPTSPTNQVAPYQDTYETSLGSLGGVSVLGSSGAASAPYSRVSPGALAGDSDGCLLVPDNNVARYIAWAGGNTPYATATPFTLEAFYSQAGITFGNGQMVWSSSHPGDGYPYFYVLKALYGSDWTFSWAPRGNAGGAGSIVNWTLPAVWSLSGAASVWHHLALTWTGATKIAELFIDGQSYGTKTSTTDIIAAPAYGFMAGCWYQGSFVWPLLTGSKIDEIISYPRVLTPQRIKAHAQHGLTIPTRLAVSKPTYNARILADNPAIYLPLNNSGGVTDQTAGGHNGTGAGGITVGGHSPGPIVGDADDTATDFDGSDDRITTSYNPYVVDSERTFEGWVYRDTHNTQDALLGGSGGNTITPRLNLETDEDIAWVANQSGPIFTWTTPTPGDAAWWHWLLYYNDRTEVAELFINGISKGAGVMSGTPGGYHASAGTFTLGSRANSSASDPADVKMARIAVYERDVRSLAAAHYAAGTGSSRLLV